MFPEDGDSVLIQTGGIEIVTYDVSLASTTVRCLESNQQLLMTGGTLSVLETGTIKSRLKVIGGSLKVTGSLRVADAQDNDIPLLHRWSFNSDANDSIGNANASLANGAVLGGGVVSLDGTDQYVALPIQDTLSTRSSSTIEIWMTLDSFSTWARIFDFGNNTQVNFFATPRGDAGVLRAAITTGGNPTEERVEGDDELPTGVSVHFALTIDSANHTTVMYVDGSPVGSATWTLDTAALGTLANIWLGRSQYEDPYFNGNFDEVRIYGRALTAQSISQSYTAGPDGL